MTKRGRGTPSNKVLVGALSAALVASFAPAVGMAIEQQQQGNAQSVAYSVYGGGLDSTSGAADTLQSVIDERGTQATAENPITIKLDADVETPAQITVPATSLSMAKGIASKRRVRIGRRIATTNIWSCSLATIPV